MNVFTPALLLIEIGLLLEFVKILILARRFRLPLVVIGGAVMSWVYFVFSLAVARFYAVFSI